MPTKIEWTHIPGYKGETWNPVTGCTKISPGCANCYAETFLMRFHRSGPFLPGNEIQLHHDRFGIPFRWKAPRSIFVNSVSDTFHEQVPDDFILEIFKKALFNRRHLFIFLTKRPARMLEWFNSGWYQVQLKEWAGLTDQTLPLDNVWLGTSVENQYWANDRVPRLLECPAVVHFVSCEPLLGPIDLTNLKTPTGWGMDALRAEFTQYAHPMYSLDQVIVGGESGNSKKIRPMHPEWARHLRDQTKISNKAFFFKQWGSYRPATVDDVASHPDKIRFINLDPHKRHDGRYQLEETDIVMIKGSKGANGHILDGEVWQEFPSIHERKAS